MAQPLWALSFGPCQSTKNKPPSPIVLFGVQGHLFLQLGIHSFYKLKHYPVCFMLYISFCPNEKNDDIYKMILQLTAYTMTLWLVLTWLAVNRFTSATCTGAEWQTRNRIFMADWACSGSGRPNWINLLQAKISLYTIVLHTISNTEWTIQNTTVLDI